ncbi:MAG TPA: mandelate racemase/muconate lactonizing enzyme family protein [Verrucomicrobiae bacterium]|jgi:L-alanine-DL-glutamate epimerase-like enolase superfamily enzyme|nr:mandelate racemase/muconate lactonizing enzyme family protein [Verrucomicrobiae bacterium]
MSQEKIARVETFPLRYAEPNNNGKTRHVTLVRLETASGASGWGEAITGSEDAAVAMKVIMERGFTPRLMGRDPRDVEAIWSEFRETTYWTGNGGIVTFAISAIDMALWDLAGHLTGLPVHRLLGGKHRDRVRAASSIIFDTGNLPNIGRQFADLRARGYGVLKGGWGHDLSIAFGRDAKRDVAIVRTMREAVGEDAEIIVDVVAGSGWTASHAIAMARAFEPHRLYWLEDALPEGDIEGWKRLRAATATPLCTGEKGWTVPHFRGLIDSGALDIIMMDPGRAEGVTGSKKIIDIAADAGMSWNAHSWSSAINTAASLHLCAASPNVLLLELKPEPSPMQNDIVSDPIEMKDGWIAVRDTPGLSVTVDEAAVRRFAFD